MVEAEQKHRIDHEERELHAEVADFRRGQRLGFVLSLVAISGSVYTAYIGAHPSVSIALVSLPIMAAIQSFLKRK